MYRSPNLFFLSLHGFPQSESQSKCTLTLWDWDAGNEVKNLLTRNGADTIK